MDSITEYIDTKGAVGKMLSQLMAVFSEFERNVICERTKSALAQKKLKNNMPQCHLVTVKYKRESEAQTVTEILAKRKSGASMEKIAVALNVQGL